MSGWIVCCSVCSALCLLAYILHCVQFGVELELSTTPCPPHHHDISYNSYTLYFYAYNSVSNSVLQDGALKP